jgi:hypothetical protein
MDLFESVRKEIVVSADRGEMMLDSVKQLLAIQFEEYRAQITLLEGEVMLKKKDQNGLNLVSEAKICLSKNKMKVDWLRSMKLLFFGTNPILNIRMHLKTPSKL